jgi:hypothetical protein
MSYELHGDTGTRLHRIWKSMKCRCNDKNHPSFKNYGARGIGICEEWQRSYTAFRKWAVSNGYADDLELERIDVNGGYSPENCKWISHHDQTMNRRDTLYITIGARKGKTMKLREFCVQNGISINTVNNWRHLDILEGKLSDRIGQPVRITGGKKGVVDV